MRNWIVGLTLVCLVSCSRTPRTRDQIFAEKIALPSLYLTESTHQRVIAPGDKGVFEDPATREKCWPAMKCTNPACPERRADGEPYLFIRPDSDLGCPACAKKRNPKTESPKVQSQYGRYVQPYVLPQTEARMKQLDEEYK